MSKPKYQRGDKITWERFLQLSPTDIIYDDFAHRATQAGIPMYWPFFVIRNCINNGTRFFYAVRILDLKLERHKPSTWEQIDHVIIHDPDGWRYDNKSMNAPLTRQEWLQRMSMSTIIPMDGYSLSGKRIDA
jgi:hypothetical protein